MNMEYYTVTDCNDDAHEYSSKEDARKAIDNDTVRITAINFVEGYARDITEDIATDWFEKFDDWELLNGEILTDRIPRIVKAIPYFQEKVERIAAEIHADNLHDRSLRHASY